VHGCSSRHLTSRSQAAVPSKARIGADVAVHGLMQFLPVVILLASASPSTPSISKEASSPELTKTFSERSVGIHVGVNLGLFAFDVQRDHFYGFVSGNLGIPLVTNGAAWAVILGAGYSLPISSPEQTRWVMDFLGTVAPGGSSMSWGPTSFYTAVGVGLGFRLLHASGFTLGFKIPVFGMAFGPAVGGRESFRGDVSVGSYYLASGVSLPVVSFGYRF
jgi:hypothetical protein